HYGKGRKEFSFEYDNSWIKSQQQRLIDPDIQFCSGAQLPNQKENFGIFLDSMPDIWGRTLMACGLNLRTKRPRRNRMAVHRLGRPETQAINRVWSMDFVQDALFNGERFRVLTIVDNCS